MSSNTPNTANQGDISPNEVLQMCKALEEEKSDKSLIIIPVCQVRLSVEYLEDNYKSTFFKRSNKRIIPTTVGNIGRALSRARKQAQRKQKLMLLVSPYVISISFHIPFEFQKVTVYRCGKLPKGRRGVNGEDYLLMDESSTFCNVNLRQWEDRPAKLRSRSFCVQGNVYLRLNLDDPDIDLNMSGLSEKQRRAFVHAMSGFDPSDSGESSFWDKWKGIIAALLGAIAGVMKFSAGIEVSGAGFYCSHWLGAKLFGGYISTSACVSASVPAVGLAFGVAAAIYFIPCESLWAWFKRLVGAMWDALSGIWDWIKKNLSSLSRVAEDLPAPPPYSMNFHAS